VAKNLVIVESPTKAKTLERYLGRDYSVQASMGHVRDLPKSKLGVATDDGFEPEYVVPEEKKKTVSALQSAAKKAGTVWLATDFDREGEAIAFHVAELLKIDPETAKRVTFTEITEDAVKRAFRNPRAIDLRLVEAQQARRILDRLVGYNISPLLWKKIRPGLSAGRVQSVALRLIVDRERERDAFQEQEYWSVDARLAPDGDEHAFSARLFQIGDHKLAASPDKKGIVLRNEEEARQHADVLERSAYRVAEVRKKEARRRPAPPFTTSTLQQEAARKLGFSSRKTMTIAQQLYEGVQLPGEGQVGLITYMRTDSVHIAEPALRELGAVIKEKYGAEYALAKPRHYRKKKSARAQEAHEAIRPTKAGRFPREVEPHLGRDQARLYRLIWQRTVASQMAEALFDQVSVDVEASAAGAERYLLRATGQTVKFDGFRRVYFEGRDDAADEDAESRLPELTEEQVLRLLEVLPEQHFTQPPPRYTEASLVKTLEELGIGRPSTYAPTISTLVEREYVLLEEKRFTPTDVGYVVTDLLVEWFPEIVDYSFTARMEEELDEIAEGRMRWMQVLDEFYGPFERLMEKAHDQIDKAEVTSEPIGETCPKCGQGNLVKKLGRYGRFISCDRFPDCDYSRPLEGQERPEPEPTGEACPECGKPLVSRVGRYGPFVGCSGYPECKYVKKQERKTGVKCPQCGEGELVQKRARRGGRVFYGCNRYPECDFTVGQRPVVEPCPECGSLMVSTAKGTKCTSCGTLIEGKAEAKASGG
jgi:DNA topoisomerase-1